MSPAILADLLMLYALHWRAFGATGTHCVGWNTRVDCHSLTISWPFNVEQEAALRVCQSLASLSETGRFALAVGLLNAKVKAAAAELFDALDAATVGEVQGSAADVRTRFGV